MADEDADETVKRLARQFGELAALQVERLQRQPQQLARVGHAVRLLELKARAFNDTLERVDARLHQPYVRVQRLQTQLEKLQSGAQLLRQLHRFLHLFRRLQTQMASVSATGAETAPEATWAAVTLNELGALLAGGELDAVVAVKRERASVAQHRETVESVAQQLLQSGIAARNPRQVSGALLVYHHLGVLGARVRAAAEEAVAKLAQQTRDALDVARIREAAAQGSGQAASASARELALVNTIWQRVEALLDGVFEAASRIYMLERVIALGAPDMLDAGLSAAPETAVWSHFWREMRESMEKELLQAARASQLVQQLFQNGYPKLLRFFYELATRVAALHSVPLQTELAAPEMRSFFAALSHFENAYLQRCVSRLFAAASACFPEKSAAGTTPLAREDIDRLMLAVSNELEVARWDAALLRAVARHVGKALQMFVARAESAVSTDAAAYSTGGSCTPAQTANFALLGSAWYLREWLWRLQQLYAAQPVRTALGDAVASVGQLVAAIAEPLLQAIAAELETVLRRVHREPLSAETLATNTDALDAAACSAYVLEFGSRLKGIQRELLVKLQCGDDARVWIRQLATRWLTVFLRELVFARPLSDAAKLRFANDLAQLEFVLSAWLQAWRINLRTGAAAAASSSSSTSGSAPSSAAGSQTTLAVPTDTEAALADAYAALRATRSLLFADLDALRAAVGSKAVSAAAPPASPLAPLPPLLLVHHLAVRAWPAIATPLELYSWSGEQYSAYLDACAEAGGPGERGVVSVWVKCAQAASSPSAVSSDGQTQEQRELVELLSHLLESWEAQL